MEFGDLALGYSLVDPDGLDVGLPFDGQDQVHLVTDKLTDLCSSVVAGFWVWSLNLDQLVTINTSHGRCRSAVRRILLPWLVELELGVGGLEGGEGVE